MCTTDKHEQIKADPVKWAQETQPLGVLEGLDWRNCAACKSTLARPVVDEEVRS